MGVLGLKSFIDNNIDLWSEYCLRDTCLAIDGNNFIHKLYYQSTTHPKDQFYGADYCGFGRYINHFFDVLDECHVRPVIVFDGGIDPSGQKIQTKLKRFERDMQSSIDVWRGDLRGHFLPRLCYEVFRQVMSNRGVRYVQSPYEADACTARLANSLGCPVLSDDSDFFVFDLKVGVISIDNLLKSLTVKTYLNPNDETDTYKYLNCRLFCIKNLNQYFPGLEAEVLPVLSALIGNDWVDRDIFRTEWDFTYKMSYNWRLKKLEVNNSNGQNNRMIRLLNWLQKKTVKESIDLIAQQLQKEKSINDLKWIQLSLDNYECNSVIGVDLDKTLHLCTLLPNADQCLPQWFVEEYYKSLLSSSFVDIIDKKIKCLFLCPHVEDLSLPSMHSCAQKLRQYLIALLRLNDNDMNAITIHTRDGQQISVQTLEQLLVTPNQSLILPNLYQLRDISIDERKDLLLDILSIDQKKFSQIKELFICNYSGLQTKDCETSEAVCLIIAIKYWIRNCDHKVWIEFFCSLLTSAMFCRYFEYKMSEFDSIKKQEISELVTKLSQYNCCPIDKKWHRFEPRIVHFYNELQDCICEIQRLNSLLGHPFQLGTPYNFLNGLFIYNLTIELSSTTDSLQYLWQMFGGQSSATNMLFKKLLNNVLDDKDWQQLICCPNNTRRHSEDNSSTELHKQLSDLKITDI